MHRIELVYYLIHEKERFIIFKDMLKPELQKSDGYAGITR